MQRSTARTKPRRHRSAGDRDDVAALRICSASVRLEAMAKAPGGRDLLRRIAELAGVARLCVS